MAAERLEHPGREGVEERLARGRRPVDAEPLQLFVGHSVDRGPVLDYARHVGGTGARRPPELLRVGGDLAPLGEERPEQLHHVIRDRGADHLGVSGHRVDDAPGVGHPDPRRLP